MTYEYLKKNGKIIDEVDFYNNGIFAKTLEFWVCDKDVYARSFCDNRLNYNGKNETYFVASFNDVKEYNEDYFLYSVGLSEDGYKNLRELVLL